KIERRSALVLLDANAIVVGVDRGRAEALAHCIEKDQVQLAAMDADLGILVAGKLPARLAIDELTEAVEETALAVLNAGGQHFIANTKRGELAHSMRQSGNADAKLLDLRHALIDRAVNAALFQVERERKPANAAADDGDLHAVTPRWTAISELFDLHLAELDDALPVLQRDRALVEHAV